MVTHKAHDNGDVQGVTYLKTRNPASTAVGVVKSLSQDLYLVSIHIVVGRVVGLPGRADILATNYAMLDHIRLAPLHSTSFVSVENRPRQESVLEQHQTAAGVVGSRVVKY
jgi:hypothetical protein